MCFGGGETRGCNGAALTQEFGGLDFEGSIFTRVHAYKLEPYVIPYGCYCVFQIREDQTHKGSGCLQNCGTFSSASAACSTEFMVE